MLKEIIKPSSKFNKIVDDETVKLLRVFTILSTAIFTFYCFYDHFIGAYEAMYRVIFCSLLELVTFVILRFHYTRLALLYYLFVNILSVSYFESYCGYDTGFHVFFIPILLAIASIFNYNVPTERKLMFFFFGLITFFIIMNYFTANSLFFADYLSPSEARFVFKINLVCSILTMGCFIFLIMRTNSQRFMLFKNLAREENKMRVLELEKKQENEILLAELQHRLKNSLSLLSSFIKIKLGESQKMNYQMNVLESLHAVYTVSQAYNIQRFDNGKILIPLRKYIIEVTSYWARLLGKDFMNNQLKTEIVNVDLNAKLVIPIGLIVHEILGIQTKMTSNKKTPEELEISVILQKETVCLIISSSIDSLLSQDDDKSSMIEGLVDQIDSEIVVLSTNKFEIQIPHWNYIPAIESEVLFNA